MLNLDRSESVAKSFEIFFKEAGEIIKCKKCKSETQRLRRQFLRLPELMVLGFKTAPEKPMKVNQKLSLAQYASEEFLGQRWTYELVAMLRKEKDDSEEYENEYEATIKKHQSGWLTTFNGKETQKSTIDRKGTPYMLFYILTQETGDQSSFLESSSSSSESKSDEEKEDRT